MELPNRTFGRCLTPTAKRSAAERLMSTKPNPNQKALVGGAAVVVATVAVAEEDVTNLTYTAPVWKQMDRGREHNGSKVLILQSAVSKILTTAAGSGAFATFLG